MGGSTGLVDGPEVVPAIEDLIRFNDLRWGEAGVLKDPLIRAFLLDAGPELDRAGLLRLWQVQLHGRRIAVLLVLAGLWAHHGYNGGFDPAEAKLSPSALLVGLAMERASQEGKSWFDFLRGNESYKALWGGRPWPLHRRVLRPLMPD
jgi:CelD/BcsL family acetyltransferase involved in cellulose biosynthesis